MDIQQHKAIIELIDSFVKECNLSISRPPGQPKENVNANMTLNYNVAEPTVQEGFIFGVVELYVKTELSDEEGVFTTCDMEYVGIFSGDGELPIEEFLKMMELNGVTVLYQLARAFITSVTAQAGISPPITLPLINVHSVVKSKKADTEK